MQCVLITRVSLIFGEKLFCEALDKANANRSSKSCRFLSRILTLPQGNQLRDKLSFYRILNCLALFSTGREIEKIKKTFLPCIAKEKNIDAIGQLFVISFNAVVIFAWREGESDDRHR